METIEFVEDICDKIFEILKDKVKTFTNEKDKDCMLALDEMSITPGTQFDPTTQSYCGYTTLSNNKSNYIFVCLFSNVLI